LLPSEVLHNENLQYARRAIRIATTMTHCFIE
jgi:hypothetical protein